MALSKDTAFTAEAICKKGGGFLGIEPGLLIKAFFGGNALVAIVVLALITIFLFREGAEFFPEYRKDMQLYRASGQELVGMMRGEVEKFEALQRELNQAQTILLTGLYDRGLEFEEVNRIGKPFREYVNEAQRTIRPVRAVVSRAEEKTSGAKEKVASNLIDRGNPDIPESELLSAEDMERLLAETRESLMGMLPEFHRANEVFRAEFSDVLARLPELEDSEAAAQLERYEASAKEFLEGMQGFDAKLADYSPEKRFTLLESVGAFLFGTRWVTNSSWQDFYGIWPLLGGSLMVTLIALVIAIPFGVCAAIYVNQVAGAREQNLIKPYIEFISAIPSVVIGFFGIAVFGTTVRWLSTQDWMSWVPFFPISERLNAFTAGALLALMAVPTIFTLAEDALNNVPGAFKEASIAMGATRWQTTWRILIPASLSGIISAVLLGFGRVIGETMVVLLCAGNRIAIPDLGQGLGAFFEPVHTMTGIIAQEMGEVVPGSIHYRALFCVGILLFFLSLGINYLAQLIVRKYKISVG